MLRTRPCRRGSQVQTLRMLATKRIYKPDRMPQKVQFISSSTAPSILTSNPQTQVTYFISQSINMQFTSLLAATILALSAGVQAQHGFAAFQGTGYTGRNTRTGTRYVYIHIIIVTLSLSQLTAALSTSVSQPLLIVTLVQLAMAAVRRLV